LSEPLSFDLAEALKVAFAAADSATQALEARFRPEDAGALNVRSKSHGALVTDADMASDKAITEVIRNSTVGGAIYSEESNAPDDSTDLTWLIDPLCGTTPYSTGLAQWGINIALERGSELEFGVVTLPPSRELLTGVKGRGASRNGRPLVASEPPGDLADIAIAVELDGGPARAALASTLEWTAQLGQVYSFVSAAFPLGQILLGRLHGAVYHQIDVVHFAAAAAVAYELGIKVTDGNGDPIDWAARSDLDRLVFAWPRTHAALLELMAED